MTFTRAAPTGRRVPLNALNYRSNADEGASDRLPQVLKYLPSDKAQDARNFMLSLQYWLGGNSENLENFLLNLAGQYVPALQGVDLGKVCLEVLVLMPPPTRRLRAPPQLAPSIEPSPHPARCPYVIHSSQPP